MKLASRIARRLGFLELWFPFADRQYESCYGLGIVVDHELEAVRQQGLEHQLQCFGRRVGWSRGDYIEPVELHPVRSADHFFRIDAVGSPDQIHHICVN